MLARRRLILNTPTSKVRSASMGLVELGGLAVGPYTINAPISGLACYYYRTIAWQWKQEGKNKQWKRVAEETMNVPFYLDDNTGKVLVDPQGAEMDIHRDLREEYNESFFSTAGVPASVSSFLARHGVSDDELKTKIEEYCIKPKNYLFVLGTLAENTAPQGEQVVPLTKTTAPASTTHMTAQGKIAAAMMKAGVTSPAAWAAAGLPCPGASWNATGTATAVAPAEDFDLHPKTVVMKGTHQPAFFISWRSQREVVKSLGWQATLMIWGGPAGALICAYILLAQFFRL